MYQINHKEIKHKKIKKVLFSILIIFILWIVLGLYINLTNKRNKTLEKIGYSNIEISIIQDILSTKEIKKIYEYDYIKSLTEILVSNDFNQKKLSNYIDYYNKYPTIPSDDLIFIINNDLDELIYSDFTKELMHHESFDRFRMNRYNDYYNKYNLNIDEVVVAVNNDLDQYNIKYIKEFDNFLSNTNCIKANINRYYQYSLKNKRMDIDTVITLVNSNLDLTPYSNSNIADTNLGNLILVNKYYHLNKDYIPNNLVEIENTNIKVTQDTYEAFTKMNNDSLVPLNIINGYISYEEQNNLYLSDKNQDKPGYSENQTGLIIEIQNNEWLENNAHNYGFIQRFPIGKKNITGYERVNYYRYVGIDVATFIYNNKITFEEYYAKNIIKNT